MDVISAESNVHYFLLFRHFTHGSDFVHYIVITALVVGNQAVLAAFYAVVEIDEIPAAFVAQRIQRAVA